MLTVEVEANETYIGASKHGKRGRGASGKTIVQGVVERQQVYHSLVPNVQSKTLLPMIIEKTSPNAIIFTDEMPSYNRLDKFGFDHRVINHNARQYVNGNIHTNTIDGFWSLVKGGMVAFTNTLVLITSKNMLMNTHSVINIAKMNNLCLRLF